MCGIVGFAGFDEPGLLQRMCRAIAHRGPDDEGLLEYRNSQISVAMRRLSIIDLHTGHQPLASPDGKVDIVFNGEIYNYKELRKILASGGYEFKTGSDTEVILASYLAWGKDALHKLHGMFAFAIVDHRGKIPKLFLGRDRTGIKPLYYICANGKICFSSEIKALTEWADWKRSIRLQSVRDYLSLRYVPGQASLFSEVEKLPAGHWLEYSNGEVVINKWWMPPTPTPSKSASEEECVEIVEDALSSAVKRHLVSDVPVGAFLSGGIDSGLLVALMKRNGAENINTFCVGYPDGGDADTRGAEQVAKALGTKHHSIECRASDIADLPEMAWSLDEPVGDPIIIPMSVLAREAGKHVKVVLSGEGADEIFGGYEFHRRLVQLAKLRSIVPGPFWQLASVLIRIIPPVLLDRIFNYPGQLGSEGRAKIADLIKSVGWKDIGTLYRESISLFDNNQLKRLAHNPLLAGHCKALPGVNLHKIMRYGKSPLEKLVLAQFQDWLADDILMKADKMSMAHSLEARVPFMDERVINAASVIPDHMKLSPHGNKWVLRKIGKKLLPPEIINAGKRPFYFPMEDFTSAPSFQDLTRRTLDEERIKKRGLFNADYIKSLQGTTRADGFLPFKRLFSIVMLELWFERFAPDASWA